jgi:hypothetical protein
VTQEQLPRSLPRLLYLGICVGAFLIGAGILTGIFFISESTPVPSGAVRQTDTFLLGPYLSILWGCPSGFTCPSSSYVPYGQAPNFAILPSIPDTGVLLTVALVPIAATLAAALWFLIVFNPIRRPPLPQYRPSLRLIGALGIMSVVTEVVCLLLIPTLIAVDLANSSAGVPRTPGPWNSLSGSSSYGHLALAWGPASGAYLIIAAGAILALVALRWAHSRAP